MKEHLRTFAVIIIAIIVGCFLCYLQDKGGAAIKAVKMLKTAVKKPTTKTALIKCETITCTHSAEPVKVFGDTSHRCPMVIGTYYVCLHGRYTWNGPIISWEKGEAK